MKRPDHVICEAFDEDMNPITVEGFGLFARALCHETDHLDGILYPDVAEEPARDVTMEEVEKDESSIYGNTGVRSTNTTGTERSP